MSWMTSTDWYCVSVATSLFPKKEYGEMRSKGSTWFGTTIRWAWRNILEVNLSRRFEYVKSPAKVCPIWWQWTRIWWRLPVTSLINTCQNKALSNTKSFNFFLWICLPRWPDIHLKCLYLKPINVFQKAEVQCKVDPTAWPSLWISIEDHLFHQWENAAWWSSQIHDPSGWPSKTFGSVVSERLWMRMTWLDQSKG